MTFIVKSIALAFSLPFFATETLGADAPCATTNALPGLAQVSSCGNLVYGAYANRGERVKKNRIPDFSHAGYLGGGVALPKVPVVLTLSPQPGDDGPRIQAALDAIGARTPDAQGFRGALLLKKGFYQISGSLFIRQNGVVLRGEGKAIDGTVLVATLQAPHDFIRVRSTAPRITLGMSSRAGVPVVQDVPVGANSVTVADASSFRAGDLVGIRRMPNDRWIFDLGMNDMGPNPADIPWTAAGYYIAHERRITKVAGNTLFLDIPMVDTLTEKYGRGMVYPAAPVGRISQVGVEQLRLVSVYASETDENHALSAITFESVENGWVRRVVTENFSISTVLITGLSKFNTVEDVASLAPKSVITGGRRYPFNVGDGMGNLFQRCYADQGRHNFVSGSRVTGPNVWLDCVATNSQSDDGPHHRWATGLLFDNLVGDQMHVQNRRNYGSGHGWAGAQVMLWNSDYRSFILQAPLGGMNWAVGMRGVQQTGSVVNEPSGMVQRLPAVHPRSLYIQQLRDRLGEQAVNAVTKPYQREGNFPQMVRKLTADLRPWVAVPSDPTCIRGVPSRDKSVCCPASCGSCGGTGCSARPGGSACCAGTLQKAPPRPCATNEAPCTIDK